MVINGFEVSGILDEIRVKILNWIIANEDRIQEGNTMEKNKSGNTVINASNSIVNISSNGSSIFNEGITQISERNHYPSTKEFDIFYKELINRINKANLSNAQTEKLDLIIRRLEAIGNKQEELKSAKNILVKLQDTLLSFGLDALVTLIGNFIQKYWN